MHDAPWTTGEVNRLLTMYFEGHSLKEMELTFQRTHGGIASALRRYLRKHYGHQKETFGKSKRLTKRQQQFVRLFEQEHDHQEVADKMGVKQNTSRREKWRLTRMGFKFPPAKNICRKDFKAKRIKKKYPGKYDSPSSKNEDYKPEIKLSRIKISHMAVNGRQYEEDQNQFISVMDKLKKRLGHFPDHAEILAEALRIGYRKVS